MICVLKSLFFAGVVLGCFFETEAKSFADHDTIGQYKSKEVNKVTNIQEK
jgi:hypothetical protein